MSVHRQRALGIDAHAKGARTDPAGSAAHAASLRNVSYDVAVIGCGRVGLPLALAFADRGLTTLGIDTNSSRLDAVREGRMPFDVEKNGAGQGYASFCASRLCTCSAIASNSPAI